MRLAPSSVGWVVLVAFPFADLLDAKLRVLDAVVCILKAASDSAWR